MKYLSPEEQEQQHYKLVHDHRNFIYCLMFSPDVTIVMNTVFIIYDAADQ